MLDTLKFVQGAVSTKDHVPVLTHFLIDNGRIQGSNGTLSLEAALPEMRKHSLVVPAEAFVRAIAACDGEPKLSHDEEKRRLCVSRGRFRAFLSCVPIEDYPSYSRGKSMPHSIIPPPDLIEGLTMLRPYMSTDDSRPWSRSVKVVGGGTPRMLATANVVLARYKLTGKWDGPSVTLPSHLVNELLRVRRLPERVEWDVNHIQVVYEDGTWIKCQQKDQDWPETDSLESRIDNTDDKVDVPEGFLHILEQLKHFVPDPKMPIIVCDERGFSTVDQGTRSAVIEHAGLPSCAFRLEPLSLVARDAAAWAPARYPGPVPFWGARLSGLVSGVRL